MREDNDLILQTLLEVRTEIAPELDENLLRRVYAIQKRHQFDRERGQPMQLMQRLIDEHLGKMLAEMS